MKEKNFSLAGTRTHESDYIRAAKYVGCKPVILNLFYRVCDMCFYHVLSVLGGIGLNFRGWHALEIRKIKKCFLNLFISKIEVIYETDILLGKFRKCASFKMFKMWKSLRYMLKIASDPTNNSFLRTQDWSSEMYKILFFQDSWTIFYHLTGVRIWEVHFFVCLTFLCLCFLAIY